VTREAALRFIREGCEAPTATRLGARSRANRSDAAPQFLSLPVFICHSIEKPGSSWHE
jgi:hypothetical protein